jgi:hypothetical protein
VSGDGGRLRRLDGDAPPGRIGPCRSGERGFVAGAEALIFGVLVFLIGTLLVFNGWVVVDTKFATSAAAREAVRAAVEADVGADLAVVGDRAARVALDGHSAIARQASVTPVHAVQERCAEVRFAVSVDVPLTVLPGSSRRPSVTVSSAYAEVIDPYRSGLPPGGSCAF